MARVGVHYISPLSPIKISAPSRLRVPLPDSISGNQHIFQNPSPPPYLPTCFLVYLPHPELALVVGALA
jgi:hypothetical protein